MIIDLMLERSCLGCEIACREFYCLQCTDQLLTRHKDDVYPLYFISGNGLFFCGDKGHYCVRMNSPSDWEVVYTSDSSTRKLDPNHWGDYKSIWTQITAEDIGELGTEKGTRE